MTLRRCVESVCDLCFDRAQPSGTQTASWPEGTRARATQMVQMAFGVGFFLAAPVTFVIGPFGWRWVLAVGALPAALTILIRRFAREPSDGST